MAIHPKPAQAVVERYDLGCIHLYREELIAIAQAVAELGEISIECDDSEATSPEDFDSLSEAMTWVSIQSKGESKAEIKVLLDHSAALVTVTYPNTLTAGILMRLRDIAWNSRSPFRSVIPQSKGFEVGLITAFTFAAFALIANLVIFATNTHSKTWTSLDFNITTYSIVGLEVALSVTLRLQGLAHVVVTNAPRAEHPSYWQRNRDTWIIGLITAVLGAVIGYLLGKIS